MNSPKFRVSLKSALIVLGAVGAGIGLLGRLYRYQPELFLSLVKYSILLGYAAQIGMTLYWFRKGTASKWLPHLLLATTMLLMPLLKATGLSANPVRSLPTWYLIEKKLITADDNGTLRDDGNVWRELDRRMMNNRLTKSDAESVFRKFEAFQKTRERQRFYTGTTLRRMATLGMVSDEQLVSLGETYFGKPHL